MFKENLYNIEVNVVDKDYSFINFHFYLLTETIDQLKKEELKMVAFCRSLLDDLFTIIEIISEDRIPEINKLVRPTIEYKETYDKNHRFFDTRFTLGKVPVKNKNFKMFAFNLLLRKMATIYTIENGRFDFEFQALKEHKTYIDAVEGFRNKEVESKMNERLRDVAQPIRAIIQNSLGQDVFGINLSELEIEEYPFLEGDGVWVSSGILLGSSTE